MNYPARCAPSAIASAGELLMIPVMVITKVKFESETAWKCLAGGVAIE